MIILKKKRDKLFEIDANDQKCALMFDIFDKNRASIQSC